MVRYHSQAVLRRKSPSEPLLLVGVTLDSTFYPESDVEATGRLILTKGLVALAPLTAVEAEDVGDAAATAIADAQESWKGLGGPTTAKADPR